MSFLLRFTGVVLTFVVGIPSMTNTAKAQEAKVTYISPAESGQKKGTAPGMQVKLIGNDEGPKEYAVIFSTGDEAYSGLLDFAEEYHVTSGHFTAIGALSSVVLGWFDPQKKMYRKNPIHEQVEIASMIGDFALYQGKPALHTHIVVGRSDGTADGGHVIEAIVSPTMEVFVTVDPVPLQKKYDPSTDLTLLDADRK
jgi:predicted DNA-binding protein with PD1-like motif